MVLVYSRQIQAPVWADISVQEECLQFRKRGHMEQGLVNKEGVVKLLPSLFAKDM